ncbi:centrosomal protein of 97 kDa isoform X2 [Polypterus senegalus]|uniref:centrosomal protein of 97 kDa isoform X2 n=1 Tax=Polypterus senegalus TaxID=55291 RepID=UPI0019629EFE|nr:centrosomal protein of 97 kDa isoform X2 [Polypterus senegalus]
MVISGLTQDKNAAVVDLSGQGIQKLDDSFPCPSGCHTLILDKNQIIKLEHLEKCKDLMQLSVANNRIVRLMGLCRLTNLRVLNLPNNSIGFIEGLKDLVHLEWFNLGGNNIKVIEQMNHCVALKHLDLSDNNISQIGDLSKLSSLKTLLLHGNSITTLRQVPTHLPTGLSILSLAENEIRDLNEVTYLGSLPELEQLSIMSNPCVMSTPSLPGYDYRPYIVSWCLNLKVLDGYIVSQKEGLKAEWLYSHGKGRSFRPGQHIPLVQYLASVCPLTSSPALQSAEDAKLEKILNKQRLHQEQLLQQIQRGYPASSSTPERPASLPVEQHSPSHMPVEPSERAVTPQINTWLGLNDPTNHSYAVEHRSRISSAHRDSLFLEDVQTDEDKLNCSLLSSESTFMPVTAGSCPLFPSQDLRLQNVDCDLSDDGCTDTTVLQFKKYSEIKDLEYNEACGKEMETTASSDAKTSGLSSNLQPSNGLLYDGSCGSKGKTIPIPFQGILKTEDPEKEPVISDVRKEEQIVEGFSRAAVKLQACWRGYFTRNFNPRAREVRSEIRLRRMQEHIVMLSSELKETKKELEEERINRLVQEEALKYLWKQLQSLQQWQQSVCQQLPLLSHQGLPVTSTLASAELSPSSDNNPKQPVVSISKDDHHFCEQSFPDSGFHSSSGGDERNILKDTLFSGDCTTEESLSSDTGSSVETVRPLIEEITDKKENPEGGEESSGESSRSEQDSSLLQQYLNSVQLLDEAEELVDQKTDNPSMIISELGENTPCHKQQTVPTPEKPQHMEESVLQSVQLEGGV